MTLAKGAHYSGILTVPTSLYSLWLWEQARIESRGGYVSRASEAYGPARVWKVSN